LIFRRLFQLQSTITLRYLKNTSPRIIDQNFPVEEAFHQKENSLIRIQTQINHINRNFHKDLDQLNFLKALPLPAPAEAAPEPAPQPAESTPDNPSPASFLNKDPQPAPKPPARAENSTETAVPTPENVAAKEEIGKPRRENVL